MVWYWGKLPGATDQSTEVRTVSQLVRTRDGETRRLNHFKLGPEVGNGKHGKVHLCYDESAGDREVAIKSVRRTGNGRAHKSRLMRRSHQTSGQLNCSTEQSIRKEIAIMKSLSRHHHYVKLFEVIDDPQNEKIYMVMEYLPGGEIRWKNDLNQPLLTVDQTRRIIRDTVVGLEYLHYNGIIHRDIKPANLLWSEDRSIVKIVDFGVSHFCPTQRFASNLKPNSLLADPTLFTDFDLLKRIGTPSFLAPELLWLPETKSESRSTSSSDTLTPKQNTLANVKGMTSSVRPPITKAIDVWALAVTLYCLLFGHTPFSPMSENHNIHHNEYMLYNQICMQDWVVDDTIGIDQLRTGGRHPKDPDSVINLLDQMLQKDPRKRISLDAVKRHPWLLQGITDPDEWVRKTSPQTYNQSSLNQWVKRLNLYLASVLPICTVLPGR